MSDERPNAMLTKTQRAFLKGEKEYTGDSARQQRYERRQAIKERVRHTMLDFQLLFEMWDERGTGEIFGESPSDGESGNGISALLGLLYSETHEHARFKNLLLRGVQRGVERIEGDTNDMIRVDFDVERVARVDVKEALERYRKRGNLSDMSPNELAIIAKLLRREEGIKGGGKEAAQAAAKAWEKQISGIEGAVNDAEE